MNKPLEKEQIFDLILKITGHIDFECETHYDSKSEENYQIYEGVLLELVSYICNLYESSKNRYEYSAKHLSKKYLYTLKEIKCYLEETELEEN